MDTTNKDILKFNYYSLHFECHLEFIGDAWKIAKLINENIYHIVPLKLSRV